MESKSTVQIKRIIWAAPLAAAVSVVVNSILYFIFSATGAISPDIVIPEKGPITLIHVIFSSIMPTLLAGIFFAIVARFSKNPIKVYTIVAIVLGLLSFANPLIIPNITIAMLVALNVMHVVVVGSTILIFRKYTVA